MSRTFFDLLSLRGGRRRWGRGMRATLLRNRAHPQ